MTHAYQNRTMKFPKYTPSDHRLWIISGLKLFNLLTSINKTIGSNITSPLKMTICFPRPITQLKSTTTCMGNTMLYLQTDSDRAQNITIMLATLIPSWPLIIWRSDIAIKNLDFQRIFRGSQKSEMLLGFPRWLENPRTLQNTSISLFLSQKISTSHLSQNRPAFVRVTKVTISNRRSWQWT